MKVERTKNGLTIQIPEVDEEVVIVFPDLIKVRSGEETLEIRADHLEKTMGIIHHHLVYLACNALEAERAARRTGKPRWLFFDTETGASLETGEEIPSAPKVEYWDWNYYWSNPIDKEGGNR